MSATPDAWEPPRDYLERLARTAASGPGDVLVDARVVLWAVGKLDAPAVEAAHADLYPALRDTLDALECFLEEADWGASAVSAETIAKVNRVPREARAALAAAREGGALAALPDDLRAAGWAVACHNDYRQNFRPHTFWLFTKGGRCVKGEGETDREALNKARVAAKLPERRGVPGVDGRRAENKREE